MAPAVATRWPSRMEALTHLRLDDQRIVPRAAAAAGR
jgi:hypothetical protein